MFRKIVKVIVNSMIVLYAVVCPIVAVIVDRLALLEIDRLLWMLSDKLCK